MERIILTILVLVAVPGISFSRSVTTPNTFTAGTTAVAASVNANFVELEAGIDDNDLRIDALLTTDTCTSPPCDLTAGTTLGGASVLTSSTDYLASTAIGVTVQAYDADLTDLADGSLGGSKIGAPGGLGIDAAVITAGELSTARMATDATLDSEWDTAAEINAATTDTDFVTVDGTHDLEITGTASFTGTLQGLVAVTLIAASSSSPTADSMRGAMFFCTNGSGCNVSLPAAVAGMNACFYSTTSGTIILDPDVASSDEIRLDGALLGDGVVIDSAGAPGDFVCILAANANEWVTLGRSGTFVESGAD